MLQRRLRGCFPGGCKAAYAIHVSKIRITGLAITRPRWDFRNRERCKNNLREITLRIIPLWGMNSLIPHHLLQK